jgi:hypothetical protein
MSPPVWKAAAIDVPQSKIEKCFYNFRTEHDRRQMCIEHAEEIMVGKFTDDVDHYRSETSFNASNHVTHENSGIKITSKSEVVQDRDKVSTDHKQQVKIGHSNKIIFSARGVFVAAETICSQCIENCKR